MMMKKDSALPLAFDDREILFCSFFCTFYFHLKPFPVCFSLTFCKGFAVYGMVFIHPFIHFLNVLIIINFTAFLTTSRAAVWMMRLAEPSCYRMAPAVAILLKNIKIFQIPSFWAYICIIIGEINVTSLGFNSQLYTKECEAYILANLASHYIQLLFV